MEGNYEKAYNDYQKAVAADHDFANVSHLSSILYAWVISESEAEDIPCLDAQKQVWLEPQQLALRRKLLSVAIDRDKGIIYAFGLGLASDDVSRAAQRKLLARKGALSDAQAWIARLATWGEAGVERPFDVSQTVVGVEMLKEFWVGEMICVVKVRAPIDCLSRRPLAP